MFEKLSTLSCKNCIFLLKIIIFVGALSVPGTPQQNDLRASLMEAIRNAGGFGKAGSFQPDFFFLDAKLLFYFVFFRLKICPRTKGW